MVLKEYFNFSPLHTSIDGILASTLSSSSFGRNSISQSSIQEAENIAELSVEREVKKAFFII